MTRRPTPQSERSPRESFDLRPELAACFALLCPAPVRFERLDAPPRGVLAELAQFGTPS